MTTEMWVLASELLTEIGRDKSLSAKQMGMNASVASYQLRQAAESPL